MSPPAVLIEAFVTGVWLALAQVLLGFSLMAGAGASATMFFSLTAVWLIGGALGSLLVRGRLLPVVQAIGVAGAIAARLALDAAPFALSAVVLTLISGALLGAYAGAYIRDRSTRIADARRVLLHENNGFIAGYIAAAALLFASTRALDLAALVLGAGLLAVAAISAALRRPGTAPPPRTSR